MLARSPALLLALLGVWEAYVDLGRVNTFVLPGAPTKSRVALWNNAGLLSANLAPTAEEVGWDPAGMLFGFVLGVLIHLSPPLRRAVYPLAVGSQAIPIAVIGVLLVFWWGFGVLPKLFVIVLICFFPVVVTTVDGLAAVDPEQLKLLRTLDASRWQAFRFAELPAALPAAISGARIALAVGVIGAYIAETSTATSGPYPDSDARSTPTSTHCRPRARTPPPWCCSCSRSPASIPSPSSSAAWRRGRIDREEKSVENQPADRSPLPARWADAAPRALAPLPCRLALSACGTKQDVTSPPGVKPFTVMLDWFPNADHAPLYSAIAGGEFRAVGLEVHPVVPPETADPLKLLAAGRVDMAISYEPQLLLARDQGLKLVSIGALVQRPLTSIIALPGQHVRASPISRVSAWAPPASPIRRRSCTRRCRPPGVNPAVCTEVNVGFNLVPAMLSGKVAATLGGFWNYEAIQLRLLRRRPVVIPVDQAGVPRYDELVLVVREDEARRRGQDLRAFMQALTRGEHAVRANPQAAAALVVKANPSLELRLQLESIRQTLPAATPANASDPYGWQEPAAWASFGTWMLAQGLIQHNPNGGLPPFTNEFLPGQGI